MSLQAAIDYPQELGAILAMQDDMQLAPFVNPNVPIAYVSW